MRTQLIRIIGNAGLEPCDRLFHNLRASRQTELENDFPSHVVCDWLGNSEAVARKHYLKTTENHFASAVAPKPGHQRGREAQPGHQRGQKVAAGNESESQGNTMKKGISEEIPISVGVAEYPLGESNPCLRTENPMSWATRRRGQVLLGRGFVAKRDRRRSLG